MRRRGLLQPVDYQGQRRELAKARKAPFADPPARCNEVWQLDFSEYETTAGGIWRPAGVTDYFSKHSRGWHISSHPPAPEPMPSPPCKITTAEPERLGGGPLAHLLPARLDVGGPVRIKLVTDNGRAFKGAAFAPFIASRPELLHIRTRAKSPARTASVSAPSAP